MRRSITKFKILCFLSVFTAVILASSGATAKEVTIIQKNEVLPKSQFIACVDLNNEGTINGDLYGVGKLVSSTGIIKGDLVAGAQVIRASGIVLGDIICGGKDVDISGKVAGDVRSGGENVSVGSIIGKNANLFGKNIILNSDSSINGNLLILGDYIKVNGKVNGYTKIIGNRITLGGEFFGDVDINLEIPETVDLKNNWHELKDGYVTILSGTIIHGKLSYKSPQKALIESGAKVNDSQWIQIKDKSKIVKIPSISAISWSLVKLILSTGAYFLLALLLFSFLPSTFKKNGDLIASKPLAMIGLGILGILSIVASLVAIIILIILSFMLSAPMIGIIFLMISIVGYVGLIYLAIIPVSLWLGNLIMKERFNIPTRFAVGLGSISLGMFILNYLGKIPTVGSIFYFLDCVVVLTAILAGIGALLVTTKDLIVSLRKNDIELKEPKN